MSIIPVPKSLHKVTEVLDLWRSDPVWKIEDLDDRTVVTLTWQKKSGSYGNIVDSVDYEHTRCRRLHSSGTEDDAGRTPLERTGENYMLAQDETLIDYEEPFDKERTVQVDRHHFIEDKETIGSNRSLEENDSEFALGITQKPIDRHYQEENIEESRGYFTGLDSSSLPFSFKDEESDDSSRYTCHVNSEQPKIGDNTFCFTYTDDVDKTQEGSDNPYSESDVASSPEMGKRWFNVRSSDADDYDGDGEQDGEEGRIFGSHGQGRVTHDQSTPFFTGSVGTSERYNLHLTSICDEEGIGAESESSSHLGQVTPTNEEGVSDEDASRLEKRSAKSLSSSTLQENLQVEAVERLESTTSRLVDCDKASAEGEVLTPVDSVIRQYVEMNDAPSAELDQDDLEENEEQNGDEVYEPWTSRSEMSNDRRRQEINFAERFQGDIFPTEAVSATSQKLTLNNGVIKCACGESFTVREETVRHLLFNCPMNLCWRIDLDIRIHQEIKQWKTEEEKRIGRKWWQAFKTQGQENYSIILAEDKKQVLKSKIEQFLKDAPKKMVRQKDNSEVPLIEEMGMTLCE